MNNTVYDRAEYSERRIRRNRIRRQRQLRRRITVSVLSFIMVLAVTVCITTINSKAESRDAASQVKCYASVMVPYGSCMSDLAEEYIDSTHYDSMDEYLNEVMFINHMTDTRIKAGSYLIMPYYDVTE